MRRLTIAILMVTAAVGCTSSARTAESSGSSSVPSFAPFDVNTVRGHRYRITTTHDSAGDHPAVATTGPPFVEFGTGLVYGDGCNQHTADYELDSAGLLKIGNDTSTLIGCPSPVSDQGGRISATLKTGATLSGSADSSSITVSNGDTSITLAK